MKIFSIPSQHVIACEVAGVSPFDMAEVDAFWHRLKADHPDQLLFNGGVFQLMDCSLTAERVELQLRPAMFAELMFAKHKGLSFNHCTAVTCVHDTKRVLMAKQQNTTVTGGVYLLPGGGLEPGDCKNGMVDLKAAAARELSEEILGLQGLPVKDSCVVVQLDGRVRFISEMEVSPQVLDRVAVAAPDEIEGIYLMTFAEIAALDPKQCNSFSQPVARFIGDRLK